MNNKRPQLVVLDLETSGYNVGLHEIIQIAAVAVYKDTLETVPDSEFDIKVHFDVGVATGEALRVNHYDAVVWHQEAHPQKKACMMLYSYLKKHATFQKTSKAGKSYYIAELAGHNLEFDVKHLRYMFKEHDQFLPASAYRGGYIDTLDLAKTLEFVLGADVRFPAFNLQSLCSTFEIPWEEASTHEGMYDVKLTLEVLRKVKEILDMSG